MKIRDSVINIVAMARSLSSLPHCSISCMAFHWIESDVVNRHWAQGPDDQKPKEKHVEYYTLF